MNAAYFQPQLDSIISELLSESCQPHCLLEPLNNTLYWWVQKPYTDMTLHYEHAEMSIVGWLNTIELITGSDEQFNSDLIHMIQCTIERQWEIKLREWAEDARHERNLVLERVAS